MKQNNYYQKRVSGYVLFTVGTLLLAACQSRPLPVSNITAHTQPSPLRRANISASPQSQGPVDICQRELAALAKINPQAYADKKIIFDNLLSSAAVYTSVRGQVDERTQDAMDALYKYKVQQVCSDIQFSVMQELMHRGEGLK